jgi:hypothetical protein
MAQNKEYAEELRQIQVMMDECNFKSETCRASLEIVNSKY